MEELFKNNNLLRYIKILIYYFKKIFCILSIKNDNVCILPYSEVNNRILINVITRIMRKTCKNVVLSMKLEKNEELKKSLKKANIHIFDGKTLFYYLLYDILEYIAKVKKENMHATEVHILIDNLKEIDEKNLICLAKNLKRVNIVTNHINQFRHIERYLERDLGVAITITNNRRKSLLKAVNIINIDFDEEMLNSYQINRNATIINLDDSIKIRTKSFEGINIIDYQMIINSNLEENKWYNKFSNKIIYESTIIGESYEAIRNDIKNKNLKIVNLIGKNGIINQKEYIKNQ